MAEPADVVAYSQEQFKAKYDAAEAHEKRLRNEFRIRRVIAYCLKAIVALGGLAITVGLSHVASQVVGIIIAVAVILDSEIFSNYKRLLATATAESALHSLVEGIEHQHRVGLLPVLKLKDTDEGASRKALVDLLEGLINQLYTGQKAIDENLSKTNVEALQILAVKDYKAPPIAA